MADGLAQVRALGEGLVAGLVAAQQSGSLCLSGLHKFGSVKGCSLSEGDSARRKSVIKAVSRTESRVKGFVLV